MDIEKIMARFRYEPETGLLIRLVDAPGGFKAGQPAGRPDSHGHLQLHAAKNLLISVHRLAFVYMTGGWPKGDVDHINGVKTDNRWVNLRDVSRKINNQNRRVARSDSRSGLLGVTPLRGRFMAQIRSGERSFYLGTFDTAEAAHDAYVKAKRALHEGCTL